MTSTETSDRSRGVAFILAGLIVVFGAHRFYVGRNLSGVLMLCTLGGLGIWWLYDMIIIASGQFRDDQDRRLVQWWESSTEPRETRRLQPQLNAVFDELDALRSEVYELTERVDFMERVLTRSSQREALPGK